MPVRHPFALLLLLLASTAAPAAAQDVERYDVVVYGGTPGGIAAAVAAAREGASVVLLEPTSHVGGLNTSGVNTAELEHMLPWTLGGLALAFYERLGAAYGRQEPVFYFESGVAERTFREMLDEAGVAVHFDRRVERVEKDGARLRTLVATDGTRFAGNVFVDASYEGDLMARADVSYTFGREGTDAYGESLAGIRIDTTRAFAAAPYDAAGRLRPGVHVAATDLTPGAGDAKVMNYNFRLCFTRRDDRVPIPAPAAYDPARYALLEDFLERGTRAGHTIRLIDLIDLYDRPNGKYEVNNRQAAIVSLGYLGGQFGYPDAGYAGRDAIVADHRAYTLGLLYFLGHDPSVPDTIRAEMATWGLCPDEFVDNGHWPYQLYVREARRMVGRYVMTQHDVRDDRTKADAVGLGSHFVDAHHVQRVALSDTTFTNEGRIWWSGRAYQIPYRSLTPHRQEADNLLVPVAASFLHVAFCTFRVESTWMVSGHAAGVAAATAARTGLPVQSIEVAQLQATLRSQGQVVDFVEGAPVEFDGGYDARAPRH